MRYYIGLSIPHKDAMAIKYMQEAFNYQNLSQPSVILVPPHMLPNDDIFVNELIKICKNIHPFNFSIDGLEEYDKKVVYLNINSEEIKTIRNEIVKKLNLKDDNNGFIQHITLFKKRYVTSKNYDKIEMLTNKFFEKEKKYKCTGIVIYQQSHPSAPFKPYIMINIEK